MAPTAGMDTTILTPRLLDAASTPAAPRSKAAALAVSVCIPNWNCRDYLRDCLRSLLKENQGVPFEVIVVDNASTDGAMDMVEDEFPMVKVYRNPENLGFAVACNQAAEWASGEHLFFLNNDTIVPPGTLRDLCAFMDSRPDAGLVGPKLIDPTGKLQISYRRKPTVAALLHRTMLFRWTGLLKRTYYDYRRTGYESETFREVEALMGAAVMVPAKLFQSVGGWDTDFRFGGEDLEFSYRIGRAAPVYYVPSVAVLHYGRISSRRNPGFAAPNVVVGYIHFFRKTGQPGWAILLYKMVVTLDAPLHLACKAGEYVWRRTVSRPAKAAKTATAMRGLWHFLRHDLRRFWRT